MVRLVVCSNSAPSPAPSDGEPPISGTPGGLVPMVSELLRDLGGKWIFADGDGARRRAVGHVELIPVALSAGTLDAHYNTVSRKTFLWLFHYLFDTQDSPSFGDGFRRAWERYEEVNRRFAVELEAADLDDAQSVVFVNDYHLALVPGSVTARRRCRLIYFHHVPWCGPDYLSLLPGFVRDRLLRSLLRCDVVGFHSTRWADAFVACCERFLTGARAEGRVVSFEGGRTSVVVAPGPIDAPVLDTLSEHATTTAMRDRLRRLAAGRRTVVRVDRIDLWKNLVRGFEAFEMVLRRHPRDARDLWFGAVVSLPRVMTDRHETYRLRCEAAVDRINEEWGTGTDGVATLLYPRDGSNTRHRTVAALAEPDAVLINPTFDGLNLVAKEAMVAGNGAPMLLSTNAGVYEQIGRAVTAVEPLDTVRTADALEETLVHGRARPAAAVDPVRRALRQETARGWFETLLAAAGP